jgi:hypothetical protein
MKFTLGKAVLVIFVALWGCWIYSELTWESTEWHSFTNMTDAELAEQDSRVSGRSE